MSSPVYSITMEYPVGGQALWCRAYTDDAAAAGLAVGAIDKTGRKILGVVAVPESSLGDALPRNSWLRKITLTFDGVDIPVVAEWLALMPPGSHCP